MADGEKKAEEHNVRYISYTVITQKSDTQKSCTDSNSDNFFGVMKMSL